MEYFDVVNKNRVSLGYQKQRGEELIDDEFNTGVEMWILNNDSILMTKRSMSKSHPGQWEVPGGCSQAGESSIDTLKREMKEEIGVDFNDDEFRLVGTILYKRQFLDVYTSNKVINLDDVVLQDEEVSDIKFVNKDEFMNLVNNNSIVPSVLNRFNIIKEQLGLDW